MNRLIRVGIVGYGNMGKGVEASLKQNQDMELVAVFTRRDPDKVKATVPVIAIADACKYVDDIDVIILCGGSATDLPEQGPEFAKLFNTVDSFDTHAKIPEYFAQVDAAASAAKKVSVISTGWDPGLFSVTRVLAEAVLPTGNDYTFWGKGVSQGHSDAIRRVPGVRNAKQYTIPKEEALEQVRRGENPSLTTREKHLRDCYIVAEEGADLAKIEQQVKTMPHYFSEYDTRVNFISEEEFNLNHVEMPHGGFVLRSGVTGSGYKHIIEFGLKLESNPEFTSSVLVAYARAAYRMAKEGITGAKTVLDIPVGMLSSRSADDLRQEML